jgi:hypothetical protein
MMKMMNKMTQETARLDEYDGLLEYYAIEDGAQLITPDGFSIDYSRRGNCIKFYNPRLSPKAVPTTARNLWEYMMERVLDSGRYERFIEVGAGLSEFSTRDDVVAIDPAPYNLMHRMLLEMRQYVHAEEIPLLEELTERCSQKIQDSKTGKLINKTLQDAVKENPELQSSAQVVVDVMGAMYYLVHYGSGENGSSTKLPFDDVLAMEGSFLEEGGILICDTTVHYQKKQGELVSIGERCAALRFLGLE